MAICKILFFLLALCIWCGTCDVFYKGVGDDVSMECGVDPSTKDSNIDWKFKDVLVHRINGKSGTRQRGSSHITAKSNIYGEALKISKLETRDAGDYVCIKSWKQKTHTLRVVSVSVKPGPVLLQSSAAELHCNITGDTDTEVHWMGPNGEKYNMKKRVISLKSVTSQDAGRWTCVVNHGLSVTLTVFVVGLQTTAVNVSKGGDIKLPCSLPQRVSQRVVGGKWKADHLPTVSFPTLTNTDKGLHWSGEKSSKVNFTNEQLSTNFDVTLHNVQGSDAGMFVCTVEFEGGVSLSVDMTLRVENKLSGGKGSTKRNGKATAVEDFLKKDVYGVQLWIWIAVGACSVVLIALIIVVVLVHRRNKRKKQRVRKLRSMRQPLTDKDYCQCDRTEKELELGEQMRPFPVPRQHRNPRTRTAGPNHTN